MRREGRQHGWVIAYERAVANPEGKRSAAHAVAEASSTVANRGFIRAPRKPTNHSKPTTGSRFSRELTGKGSHKLKHHELRMCYLDGADHAAGHGQQLDRYQDMDA